MWSQACSSRWPKPSMPGTGPATIPNVEADWCSTCGESFTGPAESKRVMLAMKLARQQINVHP
ncbi:YgiT-type zinc finger protein [Metapseudomonas resinovorans]|uniref:YgiT-type zinc finger protein n=1 Tax=Metapseudomonas resinovorans TaxID=53412 RepID=UPI000D1C7271